MRTRRALSALLVFVLALVALGCRRGPVARDVVREVPGQPEAPSASTELVAQGRELVTRFECNRCHALEAVAEPAPDRDCVGCHRVVRAGTFPASPEHLALWRSNLVDLIEAPSLVHAGSRLRRVWIEDFLQHPRDLRTGLRATMPRLDIDPAQARALAAFLASTEGDRGDPSLRESLVAQGRAHFHERQCTRCHTFPDAVRPVREDALDPTRTDAARLGPDLAVTRERYRRDALVDWIRDPARRAPGTPMPTMGLSLAEARALASYVLFAPLEAPVPRAVPPMLPALARRVTWDEVEAAVFHRTCRHCHADESFAFGDGGPGNTGGFGFAPRRLNLNSFPGAMSGALTGGERRSIFAVDASGMPRIVHALRARQMEEANQPDPSIRGMPLGHPAVTPEQLQLVMSWIASGRPQE